MFHVGSNVFLLGGPGTGKTDRILKIMRWCKRHNVDFVVACPTGVSADVSPKEGSLSGRWTYGTVFGINRPASGAGRENQDVVLKGEEEHEEADGGGEGRHQLNLVN